MAAAPPLAAHRGETLKVEGLPNPDDPDREHHELGVLLPGPHATLAGPTLAPWLAAAS